MKFNKFFLLILTLFSLFTLVACKGEEAPTTSEPLDEVEAIILEEMEASFRFFWEQTTTTEGPAYGLIRDRFPGGASTASIASVGFGLTAIPIGVENGWITKEEGEERVLKTLQTFENLEHLHGFYYHFIDMTTGKHLSGTEVSVIDTALFIAGALTSGEYFGGEIKEKAEALYARVDWNWFIDPNRKMFYMGYHPGKGFSGHWDFYAEQLIMYVLGAGTPNEEHRMDPSVYYSFIRHKKAYGDGEPFIHSWFGSIFTYQFSHAWVDFRNIEDKNGVNWFENSIHATIANRQYAIDMSDTYNTFGENSWGMTASDTPKGYNGLAGARPSGYDDASHKNDGTIPPGGALGSIVFLEEEVKDALRYFETIEGLKGQYGYKDAYNFEGSKPWIAPDVIGIDKGVTLLMLQNYRDEFVWETFMKNTYIQEGLERLQFTESAE